MLRERNRWREVGGIEREGERERERGGRERKRERGGRDRERGTGRNRGRRDKERGGERHGVRDRIKKMQGEDREKNETKAEEAGRRNEIA